MELRIVLVSCAVFVIFELSNAALISRASLLRNLPIAKIKTEKNSTEAPQKNKDVWIQSKGINVMPEESANDVSVVLLSGSNRASRANGSGHPTKDVKLRRMNKALNFGNLVVKSRALDLKEEENGTQSNATEASTTTTTTKLPLVKRKKYYRNTGKVYVVYPDGSRRAKESSYDRSLSSTPETTTPEPTEPINRNSTVNDTDTHRTLSIGLPSFSQAMQSMKSMFSGSNEKSASTESQNVYAHHYHHPAYIRVPVPINAYHQGYVPHLPMQSDSVQHLQYQSPQTAVINPALVRYLQQQQQLQPANRQLSDNTAPISSYEILSRYFDAAKQNGDMSAQETKLSDVAHAVRKSGYDDNDYDNQGGSSYNNQESSSYNMADSFSNDFNGNNFPPMPNINSRQPWKPYSDYQNDGGGYDFWSNSPQSNQQNYDYYDNGYSNGNGDNNKNRDYTKDSQTNDDTTSTSVSKPESKQGMWGSMKGYFSRMLIPDGTLSHTFALAGGLFMIITLLMMLPGFVSHSSFPSISFGTADHSDGGYGGGGGAEFEIGLGSPVSSGSHSPTQGIISGLSSLLGGAGNLFGGGGGGGFSSFERKSGYASGEDDEENEQDVHGLLKELLKRIGKSAPLDANDTSLYPTTTTTPTPQLQTVHVLPPNLNTMMELVTNLLHRMSREKKDSEESDTQEVNVLSRKPSTIAIEKSRNFTDEEDDEKEKYLSPHYQNL